jgi:hypothetical protein
MATGDFTAPVNGQSRVTIHYPEGRELLWVTADSPVFGWQVGQAIVHRNDTWVVLGRTESTESLTLTLGLADGEVGTLTA